MNEENYMNSQFKISLDTGMLTRANVATALVGATLVAGAFHLLNTVVGAFAAVLPYAAGTMLFATLLGGFYYLLAVFKTMRKNARLRISFADAYTAVAVFTVMGYFATACMHAFQGSGQALAHWNHGAVAAALFTICFGIGKFVGELWNSDQKEKGSNR